MHKYDVLEVVNEGSYGIVMKCKEKLSGSIVAIKKFKECDYEDELVRKTGFREKSILEMVSQKNIIHLRDSFKRKGRLYLVFDYVSKNLLEIIEANPKGIPPELVKYHMFQLLLSVDYLHSNQIIHRDLKPENILVDTSTNLLKLCDFGFARFVAEGEVYTEYVSTRWYRSPELILSGSYGRPADIFALGCIMAECLDGQPLFPGDTDLDQLCLIQRVCGTLETEYIRKFYRNPRFRRYKFPIARKVMSLEERFGHIVDNDGLSFLRSLLIAGPKERIAANNALKHAYFKDICLNKYYIRGNRRTKSSGPTSSQAAAKGGNISRHQPPQQQRKVRRKKRNRQTPPRPPQMLFPTLGHHPNIHPSLIHDHKIQKMLTTFKTKVKKTSNNNSGGGGGTNNNIINCNNNNMNSGNGTSSLLEVPNNNSSTTTNNNKPRKSSHKGRKKKRRKRKKRNNSGQKKNHHHYHHPHNLPQIRRLSVGSRLGNNNKNSNIKKGGSFSPLRRSSNPVNNSSSNKHHHHQFSPFKFSIPSIRSSFTGFGGKSGTGMGGNNGETIGRVATSGGNGSGNSGGGRFYTPGTYSGRLKY